MPFGKLILDCASSSCLVTLYWTWIDSVVAKFELFSSLLLPSMINLTKCAPRVCPCLWITSSELIWNLGKRWNVGIWYILSSLLPKTVDKIIWAMPHKHHGNICQKKRCFSRKITFWHQRWKETTAIWNLKICTTMTDNLIEIIWCPTKPSSDALMERGFEHMAWSWSFKSCMRYLPKEVVRILSGKYRIEYE